MRDLGTRIVALCCTLALVVGVAPLGAAGLSLDQAIDTALESSPMLQAAESEVEAAAGAVTAARAESYPTLSAKVSGSDYSGDVFYERFVNPGAPGSGNPNAPGTPVREFSATWAGLVLLTQTLYSGGANGSRVRARQVEGRIADQNLAHRRLALRHDVTRAFYDALLAEQALAVAAQKVARSETVLAAVEKRRSAEEALAVEVLGATAQLAADRLDQRRADGDVRFAKLELARLMGRPGAELELGGSLEAAEIPVDEDAAVRAALDHSPDLASARLQVELAGELETLARSSYKPKLQLEAFYAVLDNEMFFDGTYLGADLAISIPFGKDVVAGRGNVQQARAKRAVGESAVEEASAAVALAARQAVRAVVEARQAVEVARSGLEFQREKQRVTDTAFGEALATSEGLSEANTELARAELAVHAALHQARLREAELYRLTNGE